MNDMYLWRKQPLLIVMNESNDGIFRSVPKQLFNSYLNSSQLLTHTCFLGNPYQLFGQLVTTHVSSFRLTDRQILIS